ncbi:uncharacterized protein RAG0_11809 [Rhynchosporium agropyri]|uniref:Amidase domain-containing protein n=1 Tax=Rhynchosporium agropyri TaxID=914238 RepID=A0A1E1L5T2_9HELO|nr:uncharacterized protein RAG0_11809 [Rhynchosporium agropyri]
MSSSQEDSKAPGEYHKAICIHNRYLKTVYVLAPGAMKRALEIDLKRANGTFLGSLHGFPALVKLCEAVAIIFGEPTVSASFLGTPRITHTNLIQEMVNRNLSILYNMGVGLHDSWSSVAGQCVSAYVRGGFDLTDGTRGHSSYAGSSSGSAVAVSAGFAPIALGTETNGSQSTPALRAALYSLMPPLGLISGDGVLPIRHQFNTVDQLTKDIKYIADFLSVLIDFRNLPRDGYASAVGNVDSWKDIKI